LPGRGWGQTGERIGTVLTLEGTAEVRAAAASDWERLRFRDAIFLNDTVRTAADSKLKVLLRDDSILTLAERSEMQFTEFLLTNQQQRSVVSLVLGKVRVLKTRLLGGANETEVRTPNAVAGVRGSEELVAYDPPARQTTVLCVSGECYMRDPLDPARVLIVPEGHIAQQIGNTFPTRTQQASATERQTMTARMQATEQDLHETQTTIQQAQQRLLEPPGPLRGAAPGEGPPSPPPSAIITAGPIPEQQLPPEATLESRLTAGLLFPTTIGSIGTNSPQIDAIPSADAGPTGQAFIQEQLRRLQVIITIPRTR